MPKNQSIFCLKCEYDLAGLNVAGDCPECHYSIDFSHNPWKLYTKKHVRHTKRASLLVPATLALLAILVSTTWAETAGFTTLTLGAMALFFLTYFCLIHSIQKMQPHLPNKPTKLNNLIIKLAFWTLLLCIPTPIYVFADKQPNGEETEMFVVFITALSMGLLFMSLPFVYLIYISRADSFSKCFLNQHLHKIVFGSGVFVSLSFILLLLYPLLVVMFAAIAPAESTHSEFLLFVLLGVPSITLIHAALQVYTHSKGILSTWPQLEALAAHTNPRAAPIPTPQHRSA